MGACVVGSPGGLKGATVSAACLPAWRSQKATPGRRQAPGLHLHHDTCTCTSAHLARPVVSSRLTVALEACPHGVGARSGHSSQRHQAPRRPQQNWGTERGTWAPRHGVWGGPQQGLGVGAPSGQCLYPTSLAGQSWHCGSRPAHPGSGVQRPLSPAWTRGFARGGRLSRAPEDLAGAPPAPGRACPWMATWAARPASPGGASTARLLRGAGALAALRRCQALSKLSTRAAPHNAGGRDSQPCLTEKEARAQRS